MNCPTCVILADEYERHHTAAFQASILLDTMAREVGTSVHVALTVKCNRARLEYDNARGSLQRHWEEHRAAEAKVLRFGYKGLPSSSALAVDV